MNFAMVLIEEHKKLSYHLGSSMPVWPIPKLNRKQYRGIFITILLSMAGKEIKYDTWRYRRIILCVYL